MRKVALVTGVAGQDGSHLAELLLEKDYRVIGFIRRNATRSLGNVAHLENEIDIEEGDLTDAASVFRIVQRGRPNEIYNLAAQSHVGTSFDQPIATMNIDALGVVNILEAIKTLAPSIRMFQASSISFDTPVMIRLNNVVKRTDLGAAFYLWQNCTSADNMEVLTCDDDGKVFFGKVKTVVDHGIKPVCQIGFSGGRKLKVTHDHSLIVMREGALQPSTIGNLRPHEPLLTFCCEQPLMRKCDVVDCRWEFELKHCVGKGKGRSTQNKRIACSVSLTEETAYLLGMFCAEGCVSGYNATFTFGNTPFDYGRPLETQAIIRRLFDVESRVYVRNSSTQVTCSKKKVCAFFKQFVGTNAHNKRLPSEIYTSPPEVQISFLNGYLGDARISDKEISFTTVHKDLAIDVAWLLRMLGKASRLTVRHISDHPSPQGSVIRGSCVWDVRLSGSASWLHDRSRFNRSPMAACLPKDGFVDRFHKNPSRKKLRKLGNGFGYCDLGMERIQQVEELYTNLRVGDFSVDGCERWFCGETPILVHNTSELWGDSPPPQNEETVMRPRSPYAVAKLAAHWFVRMYREAYKMYCCAGITHNHEGPRRGPLFVTRKISMGVAKALKDPSHRIKLGNIDAARDWGYAPDFVEGFWMMLQQKRPDDFVFATGEMHTVGEFIEKAFARAGIDDWSTYIEVDRFMMRPLEVESLCGDPSKAKTILGWEPKVKFEQLVRIMVEHDCKLLGVEDKLPQLEGKDE